MSFDYNEIVAEVESVLAEFGGTAILRRAGVDAYSTVTGEAINSDAPSDESVKVVFMDYDERAMEGSVIQRGDQRVFMSALGVEIPRVSDLIVWVDGTYTVVNPKNISPAGVNVAYELQVRR